MRGLQYASTGTLWSQDDMSGFYTPLKNTGATLFAFVQDSKWVKGNTNVKKTQTYQSKKPAVNVLAVLRTDRIWVDRPSVMVTYTLQDEDGKFGVDKSSLSVTLEAEHIGFGSTSCSTSYTDRTMYRHMGTCQHQVPTLVFTTISEDFTEDVVLSVVSQSGATPLQTNLANVQVIRRPIGMIPPFDQQVLELEVVRLPKLLVQVLLHYQPMPSTQILPLMTHLLQLYL